MANVVAPMTVARSVKTLTLSVLGTKQDESVDLTAGNANYLIDVNGYIHQTRRHGQSCAIALVAGDNRFLHEKTPREGHHYITTNQRVALAMIMRSLAKFNRRANIESADDVIYKLAINLYKGFVD